VFYSQVKVAAHQFSESAGDLIGMKNRLALMVYLAALAGLPSSQSPVPNSLGGRKSHPGDFPGRSEGDHDIARKMVLKMYFRGTEETGSKGYMIA